ncbi:hypothetical protein BGZ73_001477 [Actinomortierella ambigua]|nr:hypothetical protein BGZ73_001477 [Actinomortierella ambigua]
MQAIAAPLSPSATGPHHHFHPQPQPQRQPQQQRRSRSRTITHSLPRVDTLRLSNSAILSGPNSSPLLSLSNDSKNASSSVAMMHYSWALATERAKRAAESALSPPISPKNDDDTQQLLLRQEANSTPVNNASIAKDYTTPSSRHRDINNEAVEATATAATAATPTAAVQGDEANSPQYTPSPLLSTPSVHFSHPDSLPSQLLTAGPHMAGICPTLPSTATADLTGPSAATPDLSVAQLHQNPKIVSVPFATQLEKLTIDSRLEHTLSHRQHHHLDTPPSSDVASPTSPSLRDKETWAPSETPDSVESPTLPAPVLEPLISPIPPTPVTPATKPSISYRKILRRISDEVDGRDKTVKVIQYFAKVFLWLFLADSKRYKVLAMRVKALAKQFSTTRKVLRLGHFVDPLAAVLLLYKTTRAKIREQGLRQTVLAKPKDETWRDVTRSRLGDLCTVLGFVQDIADDLYCLGSIGVLDKVWADKSEPWSIYLWMVGVTIDLHENLQSIYDARKQLKRIVAEKGTESPEYAKQARKIHWLQVTTVKLGGDFLFCGYDALHCSFSDGFQAVTGLASGLAGAYKYLGKLIES